MNDRLRSGSRAAACGVVALLAVGGARASADETAVVVKGSGDSVVEHGVYHNVRLNLRAELPRDFGDWSQAVNGDQFSFKRTSPTFSSGLMMFWPDPSTSDFMKLTLQAWEEGMLITGKHVDNPREEVDSAFGRGYALSWTFKRGMTIRMLVLPVCGGKATLTLTQWFSDAPSRAQLDAWAASFQPLDTNVEGAACRTADTASRK